MIPNKPVYLHNANTSSGGGEAFAEVLKSFHALSSTISNSAITSNNYNVMTTGVGAWATCSPPISKTAATVPGTENNNFFISSELQTFSNRNDTILSGVSCLNTSVYLVTQTLPGTSIGTSITVDVFAQMDMILVLQDGMLSPKY